MDIFLKYLQCFFFLLKFYVRFPFDWKTPIGYVFCSFIETKIIYVQVLLFSSILALTVGFCLFIASFANDIKEKIHQLNKYIISLEAGNWTTEQRAECKKKIQEIIQFHTKARE